MFHLKGLTGKLKLVEKKEMVLIVFFFALQLVTVKGGTTALQSHEVTEGIGIEVSTIAEDNHVTTESSPESCGIPAEGSDKLERALQNASMAFLIAVDDSKDEPRDLCASLMTYIMTQAYYMLQQARFLADIALENTRTFEILKAGFKIELAQFAAILDNLDKGHREEVSAIKKEFSIKFIQFQNGISDLLDQLDSIVELKKEAVFELCVSEIRNGEYQSALSSFKKLGNSHLTELVTSAYGGEIEYLSNVIKFIKVAESCDHQALAYQAIFDKIKIDDHLSHPNILYFSDLVEECVSDALKNELKEFKKNIIKSLIYEYKMEKVYEALEFENKFPADEASVKFEIYSTLFDELESHGHSNSKEMIALAYRVQRLVEFCKGEVTKCRYLKPNLASMEERFPDGLRALLFSPHVTIESAVHKGYTLYATSLGEVFTAPNSNNINQKWLARSLADGNYIELENTIASGKLFVRDSNLYYGTSEGTAGHWEVIPGGNGNYYLKNRKTGKAMDANSLDSCSWSGTGFCSSAYTYDFSIDNNYLQWKFS